MAHAGTHRDIRWSAIALMGLATVACSVDEIDYTGLSCPCIAGYQCDSTTQRCVREGANTTTGTAGTGGGGGAGGASTGAGTAGSGGGPGGQGGSTGGGASYPLVFSDEFDGDLSSWQELGDGVWSVQNGHAVQSADAVDLAFIYATGTFPDDLRIVSAMRQQSGSSGGAVEITFRGTTAPTRSQYFCNWEPNAGRLVIMGTQGGSNFPLTTISPQLPVGYDPLGTFTLQVDVVGNHISCLVEEVPGAATSVTPQAPNILASGWFGLKTFQMAAEFDFIRVYDLSPR
ncbi:MAG: hypothetical protein JRI23_08955 [Deltaproteobacteria bacterium]|jgi:hypothetical protein|nr:hypothetical protein [Deltaproteobacteria bacterium]MBW2531766.1 hypothetical protein [Deltaproteobacteria bacterium]